jgi:hypothetical protein
MFPFRVIRLLIVTYALPKAFRKKDQTLAENLRGKVIDTGLQLLQRYFIHPPG